MDEVTSNWLGVLTLSLLIIFCSLTFVACAPKEKELDRADALEAIKGYHACIERNYAHRAYRWPLPHWVEDSRVRCFHDYIDEEYEEAE